MRTHYAFLIAALAAGAFPATAFAQGTPSTLNMTQVTAGTQLSTRVNSGSGFQMGTPQVSDSESCVARFNSSGVLTGTSCEDDLNGWLSFAGYITPTLVSKATLYSSGDSILASATVQGSSGSNWTSGGSAVGINVDVSIQANASSSQNGVGAQTPGMKTPLDTGDAINTSATIWSPKQTTLTVSGLTATANGSTGTQCQPGSCTYGAVASWNITVTQNGIVVAQYNQLANGSTFTATIPANSQVVVSWGVAANASAGGANGFATATATVNGTVTIK